ncbi:LPS export ABC transporter periplasmic protein LptC [Parasediminibacterium sp. JCM 36343]|uniref:LPS export ABC transporter periplasmic protein LptC n=1 Tax=Parasediminibacterium sp. JCM 36343 TaxID=3374279 RepID=UPI003978493B
MLIFSMLGFLLGSCENNIETLKALSVHKTGIEEGKNIESLMTNGGKANAKLTAPLMLRYQTDSAKVEFPKSLHVDFYDSATTVESQLFAKFGRYLENDNRVFLKDSVIVFNRKKDTLWCNELYWDQAKGIFYTDKPVIISQQSPRQKIYGQGLNADQNFKWFTLHKIGRINTGKQSFINIADSVY